MTLDPDDVSAKNDESLRMLARSLMLSQGQFSLILARCNYTSLRQRLVQQLRERCPIEFRERVLDPSVSTLETTIQAAIEDDPPSAIIISGLESVRGLDALLIATNQARDEFRENFSFPLVLWGTDEVLRRLIRVGPDFKSWATTIEFEIASNELIHFIQQTTDEVFAKVLEVGASVFIDNAALNLGTGSPLRVELESARHELQSRGVRLEPELEASLEFVLGRDVERAVEESRQHLERSLALWQTSSNLERQGCVLYSLGIWWRTYITRHEAEGRQACSQEKDCFQKCVEAFEQANRKDLVAKFINALGAILQEHQQWDELEVVANKALTLHQTYPNPFRLARAYGFLAEVAISKFAWTEAKQFAERALSTLANAELIASNSVLSEPNANLEGWHQGWYLFSLARSLATLSQPQKAIAALETAILQTKPYYDPELYIRILEKLRSLYFEQGYYLKAFEIKQERRSIEQQYGFRAFVGAGRLQPKQQVINPVLTPVEAQGTATQEITASGRQQDVNRLIERLSRDDHKLTVIQGQSGVGKSSILQAGLIPALKQKAIGTRNVIPVLQQVYPDWLRVLGQCLAEAMVARGNLALDPTSQLLVGEGLGERSILEQLQKNADNNLLTVLIFDQFEEFFFVCKEPSQRRSFYEFLRKCLDIPYVKVILSLREDYLYYLLECNNRLISLDVINNNILDKNILYHLGNFSEEDAKAIIKSLTEQTQFPLELSLIDALVQDLAGELHEVRPIEMQVVGAQLQTEKITKLEQYQEHGPKEKLVGRFLEEVVKDCGSGNEQIAKLVLYLLTDENNTRPLKTRGDLELELDVPAEKLDLVLEIFVKSRLVFQVPALPVDRYQLVHDYLVAFVRQQQSARLIAELDKEREQRKLTEAKLNQALKQKLRATRLTVTTLGGLLLGIGGFALIATVTGINLFITNLSSSSAQNKEKELDRVVSALKAANKFKQLSIAALPSTKLRVLAELNQAVISVTESNRLEGLQDVVTKINFSLDSKKIVTVSEDGTAKLWRRDGSQIGKVPTANVTNASFSPVNPDGKLLATASKDGEVILWDINDKKITARKTLTAPKSKITNISFSRDGKMLATAREDKTVEILSIDGKGNVPIKISFHEPVTLLSFSPDGKTLATSSQFGSVKLWNFKAKQIGNIDNYGAMIMRFSSDGKTLTLVDKDGTVKLWSIKNVLLKNTDNCQKQTLKAASLSSDGNFLVYNPTDTSGENYIVLVQLPKTGCYSYSSINYSNKDSITDISFSPDGKWLASASEDKTVKLKRVDKHFKDFNDNITRVKYSNDGKTIAMGRDDNKVELQKHNSPPITILVDSSILSFSPDGKTLATGSIKDVVTLWSPDGKEIRLKKPIDNINSLNVSPDGQLIVVASEDNKIQLVHRNGIPFKSLSVPIRNVKNVKFSPDGKIITAIGDNQVVLWHRDGRFIKKMPGHTKEVTDVTFSPNSQFIASFGDDNVVNLWRRDGKLIKTLIEHKDRVTSVIFSPDSSIFASVSNGGRSENSEIGLWRSKDGTSLRKPIENYGIQNVNFSPDGKTIASINADNTVKLWSLEEKSPITLKGHNAKINSLNFSRDSKRIATASDDGTVGLWSGINSYKFKPLRGHNDLVYSVSFSSDGKRLVSASKDKTVKLWNSSDGSFIKSLPLQSDGGNSDNLDALLVSFSSDDKIITSVSGSQNWSGGKSRSSYTMNLWKNDGEQLATISGQGDYDSVNPGDNLLAAFKKVSFSDNGKTFALASREHTINLWNLDGTLQKNLKGHNNWVNSVSFSPDSKYIASGSDDKTIRLWRRDGSLHKTIREHKEKVNSVSFSPNGNLIASASDDKTVKLWNIDGTPYQLFPTIEGRNVKVTSVRFSPDSKTLAYASESGIVRLWSISDHKDRQELQEPDNSNSNSNSDALNFSSDGTQLALGGSQLRSRMTLYMLDSMWFKATQLYSPGVFNSKFSPSKDAIIVTSNDGKLVLSSSLDELMTQGCNLVHDYLKNNSKVAESDRHLCDGLYTTKASGVKQ